ncbi:MAG: lysophospholipid acyltransferase family protein [Bacteroidota bacterium]|nr:lysophospholipid acyltransferase family protein [Bacteroidota bacterium]
MKFVQIFFQLLYRVWFYILVTIPILIMAPLLIVSILNERWYPFFFALARVWAKVILFGMGFRVRIEYEEPMVKGRSYMLIANHTSMTDIMLMLYIVSENPFVFVGKKELAKLPIFGFFYKRTSILVDRKDAKSRKEVFEQAQRRFSQGLSVCIFPEGGVPDDKAIILDNFKDGAFRLAIEHQIPIVPITFYDNKERFSYDFPGGSPGVMRAKVHKTIDTAEKSQDNKKELKDLCYNIIFKELTKK